MLPKTVKVFGIPYRVEKQDRITVDGYNRDAQITYNTARIDIVDGMPIEVERPTLLHEIAHAMLKAQGQKDYQHDEAVIEAFAHGMVDILRANPQLVAYLMGMNIDGTTS